MKHLKKYLNVRTETICSLLEKQSHSFTPKNIHKLRIEIKKLNALFEMIEYCCKGFKQNSMFKPYKLIFKQAGKVRELQVEEAMLTKYLSVPLLENYGKELKKNQMIEQRILHSVLHETSLKKLNKITHETQTYIGTIDVKNVKRYMERNKNKIKKILTQNNLETNKIHELRKRIKMYYYNQKSQESKSTQTRSSKNSALTEILGKWHDCQIIIRHLNIDIFKGRINPQELIQLKKIKSKIISESKQLLSKIKAAIPSSEFLAIP